MRAENIKLPSFHLPLVHTFGKTTIAFPIQLFKNLREERNREIACMHLLSRPASFRTCSEINFKQHMLHCTSSHQQGTARKAHRPGQGSFADPPVLCSLGLRCRETASYLDLSVPNISGKLAQGETASEDLRFKCYILICRTSYTDIAVVAASGIEAACVLARYQPHHPPFHEGIPWLSERKAAGQL